MNIRGVFLHVLGDALGSIVVIVSALVVWLSDWEHKEVRLTFAPYHQARSLNKIIMCETVFTSRFRIKKMNVEIVFESEILTQLT